ncbi:TraR/DksA family transcriptional regulator [Roseivivax sediminis]|uniref:RNA polymerase-binding transcription factor DksA n=1 Tax=Roseivivax sediminis TaxID=936889 RepID=A0A1I1VPG9_9RHOB|nr:TraR/DksA family transcriptional regulator [Roseivivax sediminis]SFD84917.1 RNA polymerase-binding transcription factor DksA [Roseivivax sediminis]
MMGEHDWSRQQSELRQRREELTGRLARIERELDRPGSHDDDDRAIEREGDEVLEDLGLAGQRELVAIEAALTRIDDGSYGLCAVCGAAIAPARLQSVPTAAVCRDCA